jgi:Protein of unknown function (DUF3309)
MIAMEVVLQPHFLPAYSADLKILRSRNMSLGTILLIILVLALVGAIPTWPHSRGWGYAPGGGISLLLIILVILLVSGRI